MVNFALFSFVFLTRFAFPSYFNVGDVIVQNGSNSAVGVAVIQLARAMDVKTINIVRDRPDMAYVSISSVAVLRLLTTSFISFVFLTQFDSSFRF